MEKREHIISVSVSPLRREIYVMNSITENVIFTIQDEGGELDEWFKMDEDQLIDLIIEEYRDALEDFELIGTPKDVIFNITDFIKSTVNLGERLDPFQINELAKVVKSSIYHYIGDAISDSLTVLNLD